MAVFITPELMEAAYELLRVSLPFRRWKLPHPDEIAFHVTRHGDRFADAFYENGRWTIRVSQRKHGQLPTLLMTMAHEMVHIKQRHLCGERERDHGRQFQRLADQVCRVHGFDRAIF